MVANPRGLEAALAQPFQAFKRPLYPTLTAKAAVLFHGLIKNHALVDGNKRMAVTTFTTFLLANGRHTTFSDTGVLRYALRIAAHHGPYPLELIDRWTRRHSVWYPAALIEPVRQDWVRMLGPSSRRPARL